MQTSLPTLDNPDNYINLKGQFKRQSVFKIGTKHTSPVHNEMEGLLSEDSVPESGLFKGKVIKDLPTYMQRIYLKKKVLYSRHEVCLPSSRLLPPADAHQ